MTLEQGKTVAVIGAGIAGLTTARALQKAGFKVALFDGQEPGMGASFGNAGYIAADEVIPLSHGINPLGVAKMLINPLAPLAIRWQHIFSLLPWFLKFLRYAPPARARQGALALTALQKQTLPAWKKLAAQEKLASLIHANGAMIVFETEAGFKQEAEKFPFLEEQKINFRVLDGDQAREKVPELSKSVAKAVFYPDGRHTLDPFETCKRIFENFKKNGGKYIPENVLYMEGSGVSLEWLQTKGASYKADAVVVATGYQSGEVLRPLKIKVPIVAERGYHAVMEHAPLGFDMAIGSHERGFFITPMKDGLRLAGTVEFSPADKNPPPNWRRADILIRHTKDLLPGVLGKEKSRWMGHRPTLPDFLPVLGADKTWQNLYFNFGHQHLGLTLAPVTAGLLADLISTGKSPIDLTPFDIARF